MQLASEYTTVVRHRVQLNGALEWVLMTATGIPQFRRSLQLLAMVTDKDDEECDLGWSRVTDLWAVIRFYC